MVSVSPTKVVQSESGQQRELQRMQLEVEAKVQGLKEQHMELLKKQQGAVAHNAVAPVDTELEKLKQDLRNTDREAANLQGSYVVLKQVLAKTEHELVVSRKRIEELERQLKGDQGETRQQKEPTECSECKRLRQRLMLMESEREREQQELGTTKEAVAELQRSLQSLQEEQDDAVGSASDADLAALRKEFELKAEEIEGERHQHDEKIKKLQAKADRYHHQSKTSHSAVTRLQREVDELRGELKDASEAAEAALNSLRETEAALRAELRDAKTALDEECSRQSQTSKTLKEQLTHERQQATAERKTVAALQKQVDALQEEAQRANDGESGDLESLRESNVALRQELQALKTANEATSSDYHELQTRCQGQQKAMEQLQATVKQQEADCASLSHKLQRLRAELAEGTNAQLQEVHHQLEEARASEAKSAKKFDKQQNCMHTEASATDQELQALRMAKQAVEREKHQLQTQLQELQERMQTEEPPNVSEVMVLKTAKHALEKEKLRLTKELDKLQETAEHDRAANEQLVKALTREKLEGDEQRLRLERELEELRQEREDEKPVQREQLEAVLREKQEVEKEKRRLEIENERLGRERQSLQQEIELLKDEQLMKLADDGDTEGNEHLQQVVATLTAENKRLHEQIDKLLVIEQLSGTTHTKQAGGTEDASDIPRFKSRDLERESSPRDSNVDWKSTLSKPKAIDERTNEKSLAMRYGGRNILARGGDTITYLSK